MSQPIVSVVIPAYNRAASIRTAVDSALAQSVREIEVIVVDDASEDDTVQVVFGIDDPRVRLIRRERNGGASAARNAGIAAAKGGLIAFLDSDDAWMPGKLERQIGVLQGADAAAAVSCTGVEMHLLDHGVMRIQCLEDTADWGRRLAMGCDLSPGTTQMSRRHVFDLIGPLDETFARFEDWDWLLRYTRTGRIAALREPLARVNNRRAGHGDAVERSAVLFLAKHRDVFDALPARDRRQAVSDMWLQVTGTYAFEGRLKDALPSIRAALRQRPIHTMGRLATGATAVLLGSIAARRVPRP